VKEDMKEGSRTEKITLVKDEKQMRESMVGALAALVPEFQKLSQVVDEYVSRSYNDV